MADVIRLGKRRAAGETAVAFASRRQPPAVVFHFDLACPFSYLALERVERLIPGARWRPTCGDALRAAGAPGPAGRDPVARAAAERRAHELRMPLVWPPGDPLLTRRAMRAAHYAAEIGRARPFSLAAARLAFCGGFDLGDPEVLAEAAAAAGIGLDACLRAAADRGRDDPLEEAGRRLLSAGADRLPALRVGRALHCGEARVAEVAAMLRESPGRGTGVA
jgi:2-hydroxychromene-2-carboxylate isomerase